MAGVERRTARAPRESRRRGREAAIQMLYQHEIGRMPIEEVCRGFWSDGPAGADPGEAARAFAESLAHGVVARTSELDPVITAAAEHWRLERMNVLDRLILRLAVYEFLHEPETPGKVVINEALELARAFGADDSVRFINGVLDGVRRSLGRE